MTRTQPGNQVSPLVTIVTPTYNREAYLRWTINSVRNQTYSNLEHIVVDGASTDGTIELLRKMERTYRMRWTSAPDAGMYHAINDGLQHARGEILAYLNSDDVYFPWAVEAVVDAFQRHPEADFIYGDALAVDDETGKAVLYWMLPFDLDYIRRNGFLAQPTVFWRKSAFERIGPFDVTLRYVADCDYWMRAGADHSFMKIDEFLAIERLHRATLREAIGAPLWAELAGVRSRYVSLDGPDHERRVYDHDVRRGRFEHAYKRDLLFQSFLPRMRRNGRWTRLLNSGMVDVERLRYVLRAAKVGKVVPGLRRWTARDFLRAERSILEPRDEGA